MKRSIFSFTLILTSVIPIAANNAFAGGCSSHMEKKASTECLSSDKECLENSNKENLNKVEA